MKIFVNLLTTIRLVISLIIPLIKSKVTEIFLLHSIIFLFITDSIDGFLARKFKVQTLYGSILDTVADKALSMVLMLLIVDSIPILLELLIGELIIAIINVSAMKMGKVTKSSYIGKIKMWLLSITIICSYMNIINIINIELVNIIAIITIALQILAIVKYLLYFYKQDKRVKNKIKDFKMLKYKLFNTEYYLSIQ